MMGSGWLGGCLAETAAAPRLEARPRRECDQAAMRSQASRPLRPPKDDSQSKDRSASIRPGLSSSLCRPSGAARVHCGRVPALVRVGALCPFGGTWVARGSLLGQTATMIY
jgi:hypothetical protein